MPTISPFPPAAPSISGSTLTVDLFLNNPARVQRTLQDLTRNRFIADRIFSAGPAADGGAVVHDQLSENDLFMDRDVQEIAPGSEFPILNESAPEPLVALVKKWGGSAGFTYEQIRRNRLDVLQRNLIKLRNTIVRKVDTVAISVLNAAPIPTAVASGDWTTAATDIIVDIETGKSAVDALDMGYEIDTVLLNPAQALDIRTDGDIRLVLPRENRARNLLDGGASDLDQLLGINEWHVSNRVPAGTVYLLDSRTVGFISDEIPGPYTRVVDEPTKERRLVMAARVPAMGVTDPKAVYKITGA
jgi:hypothetical protein